MSVELGSQEDYVLGMTCARCNERTGNWHQGHYWKFCKKEGRLTEFHFCCPSLPCEYEALAAATPFAAASAPTVEQSLGAVAPVGANSFGRARSRVSHPAGKGTRSAPAASIDDARPNNRKGE